MIGRGDSVVMLVEGLHIRVVDQETAELLRNLTLDATRDYERQK
jgi:hypothetical protein